MAMVYSVRASAEEPNANVSRPTALALSPPTKLFSPSDKLPWPKAIELACFTTFPSPKANELVAPVSAVLLLPNTVP